MDVRCDRCQTEYELDDESVGAGGASVQCTTCGHTFIVARDGGKTDQLAESPQGQAALDGEGARDSSPRAPAERPGVNRPAGQAEQADGPQAPDWMLVTDDGQTHRFRDLTTLQKWVRSVNERVPVRAAAVALWNDSECFKAARARGLDALMVEIYR